MFAFSAANEDLDVRAPYDGRIWLNRTIRTWWMHRHTELECNLVVRGSARYLMRDRAYVLTPDTIVWLFPHQDHLLLEQSADHCMWTIVVTPELLARSCSGSPERLLCADDPAGHFCRRVDHGRSERLKALLEEVSCASGDPARYNAGLAYAILCLWAAFLSAPEAEPGPAVHPAVESVLRALDEQPDMSVRDLAGHCGLSVSQLSRVFHGQVGMPLVRFRNRHRIARFFQLYAAGRLNMHHAAAEAGFGSYSQFHRTFTTLMGCSPAAWQQTQRKGRVAYDERDPFASGP